MARDPRYDVLFEPVQVGPKTLPNRFWQVPHCNGVGERGPGMQAAFRGMKAEGGWGSVFTEACLISPDSDILPWTVAKLWDQGDVRNLSVMCDSVHGHGALAGVELLHCGPLSGNPETRRPGRAVSQIPLPSTTNPMASGRELDRQEIREIRAEHVQGFKRARAAGFDLLTMYAVNAAWPIFFLYPFFNKRTDEYGGSFENRIRFTRELLEDLHEEIDDCAIGIRFAIDTLDEPYGYGAAGVRAHEEGKDFIAALDPLVDYWDIVIGKIDDWGEDSGSSRFFETNHEAAYTRVVKEVSSKPVVNVGRFTDPEVMLEAIKSGQCDIIGAARPSIADPFLPSKIDEGRLDDIRECIGCNVCISRWEGSIGPIFCTQNATSGEEYRRGWHPERFSRAANADNDVLVVGAGPAGMECARVLGERGYRRVHLVDAGKEIGGHVRWTVTLPGLGKWARVIDYRKIQLAKLKNVTHVPRTQLSTEAILEYGADYVVMATGSHWDTSGMQWPSHELIEGGDAALEYVVTPEQVVVEGKPVGDRVVVYDTDGYFVAASVAELLARQGKKVTYVTPYDGFAPYMRFTLEEHRMYRLLDSLGAEVVTQHVVAEAAPGSVSIEQAWSGKGQTLDADTLVLVTHKTSDCATYNELREMPAQVQEAGIKGLFLVGDADTPGIIAQAIFAGHRLAREFDTPNPAEHQPFIRERRLIGGSEEDYLLSSPALSSVVPDTIGGRSARSKTRVPA
jgi:dimethylamine/trimethylamine dehydrogenase